MSLILEALKKSENQRRLGEMPNLATPVIATRKRRSLLPVLVAGIAVALAAAWWLQRDGTPAVAPAEPQVAAPAAVQPTAERRPALADAAKTPATTASPVRTPRSGEATKPVPANPPADAVADVPSPPAPAAVPAPGTVSPNPAAPAAANPPPQVAAAPAVPVVAATPAAPSAAVATEPALPKLWELPYATRRELPTMQLTMQVYSDDPGKRFVILNDVRQTEGAELGKGLYLREIRQDGLVMEVDGTRFFYPRGGR